MLLLQVTIFASTLIIDINGQGFDLSQYQCTSDNNAQCDVLQTQYGSTLSVFAPGSVFTCNTVEGICSLTCTSDSTCTSLSSFGVNGLTCDEEQGYCTTDLSCTNSTDCTLTGFSTCANPPGICIPDSSNVCVSADNCTVGLKNCAVQTVQGKNVTLCLPEPCDNTTNCISDGYICSLNNICVLPCTTDTNCDPGINTEFSNGAICDIDTGLCINQIILTTSIDIRNTNQTEECDDTFIDFTEIQNGTCGICFCIDDYNEQCVEDINVLVKNGKTNQFMTECSFKGQCEINDIDFVNGYESMECGCQIYECKDTNGNGMSIGVLIGIIAGGVCFVIVVILLGIYFCRKKRSANQFGFQAYEVNHGYNKLNDGQTEIQL